MTLEDQCYDLAGAALEKFPHLATTKRIEALASHILHHVDWWITVADSNYEPPDPPGFEGGFAPNH